MDYQFFTLLLNRRFQWHEFLSYPLGLDEGNRDFDLFLEFFERNSFTKWAGLFRGRFFIPFLGRELILWGYRCYDYLFRRIHSCFVVDLYPLWCPSLSLSLKSRSFFPLCSLQFAISFWIWATSFPPFLDLTWFCAIHTRHLWWQPWHYWVQG